MTSESQNHKKAQKPKRRRIWTVIKWLFGTGFILGVFLLIFASVYVIKATKDLPTLEALKEYSPPVMSRVQAGDGKLIAEYGIEKRVYVPIQSIPKTIQHALVASEDKRFYEHDGFDSRGFMRAMVANLKHAIKKERFEGGSTLTQQVAKNFLVGNERKIARKIREVFIAKRIEKATSKDRILELYLNEMYFGRRAYGIAGASLNYFDKPLNELTLGQAAYLAGLVRGPNNYQPDKNLNRAIARRNYVLSRMLEDGYITEEEANAAKAEDLVIKDRLFGEEYLAADYFVAEVRKQIGDLYGEKQLNEGGLSIRTTLDTKMQLAARKALRKGIEDFDLRHGYRGPFEIFENADNWKTKLAEIELPRDIGNWKPAFVLSVDDKQATIGFSDADEGKILLDDLKWAKAALKDGKVGKTPKTVGEVLAVGEVIIVAPKNDPKQKNTYLLRQIPEVNGGIIAMDPHTGRVLALVGGYSFKQNQFNRATQAYRQPGSAFKPFVYAAALDNGFTPVSKVLDAPFVIEHNDREEGCEEDEFDKFNLRFGHTNEDGQIEDKPKLEPKDEDSVVLDENGDEIAEKECGPVYYKPANFNAGKFYGLSTLRLGLEKSRNAMTVRLANDIGMTVIGQYGRNFGIYDETKPELAWALGAGETTLLRLAAAYGGLVNGGKKLTPTLLDRVQDNQGKTIYIHDKRVCPECKMETWNGEKPPELPDERAEILSPITAYQITSMLEGVVQRGTGWRVKRLKRPIAGKTGTTNDFKDAWFMGYSPDLVTGVYIGYDTPKPLGTETGSRAASPIFTDFMEEVLKNKPKVSFRIPEGVMLVPVDKVTGEPTYIGAPGYILEAFKPGTEPRLGESRSKISIAGGTGYDDYDFGFSSDENGANNAKNAENSGVKGPTKPNPTSEKNTTQGSENAKPKPQDKTAVSDVNPNGAPEGSNTAIPPKKPAEKKTPPKPNPTLEPKPDEDVDIDDGLY